MLTAFDYWDSARFVREQPAREIPYICFANGKNDSGIGWQQAWLFLQALIDTRRSFKFNWGQAGHGQRSVLPGPARSDRYIAIDIDRDKTLPAFTNCSLDDDPGNGDPNVGGPSGQINGYLLWQPNDAVDEPGRWEMTVYLILAASQDACTVDITPRRCRSFMPISGNVCQWSNIDIASSQQIESGTVTPDQYGLVTLQRLTVSKTKNRIVVTYDRVPGDVTGDGIVDIADILVVVLAFGSLEVARVMNPRPT